MILYGLVFEKVADLAVSNMHMGCPFFSWAWVRMQLSNLLTAHDIDNEIFLQYITNQQPFISTYAFA